jgi:hypothetical protein
MPALEASFAVLFIAIPGPTARAGNRRWLIESSRAGQTRERQDAIVVGVPPPQSEFDPAGLDQANFCREEHRRSGPSNVATNPRTIMIARRTHARRISSLSSAAFHE